MRWREHPEPHRHDLLHLVRRCDDGHSLVGSGQVRGQADPSPKLAVLGPDADIQKACHSGRIFAHGSSVGDPTSLGRHSFEEGVHLERRLNTELVVEERAVGAVPMDRLARASRPEEDLDQPALHRLLEWL